MKKILLVMFALFLCFTFSISAFAEDLELPRLLDGAELLTDAEEKALLKRMNEVSEKYKVDIVIATFDSTGGTSVTNFAVQYYKSSGFGYGEKRDGVQLFICMEDRDWRIDSFGLGASAISTTDIDEIGDAIVPSLSDGEYADAFLTFVDECEYQINGAINGFPFDFVKNLVISIVIGIVIAFVVTGIWRLQLKSVRKQPDATQYTKPGSMQVTYSNDFYLYNVVNRQKISSNSSSRSSSGSSHNSGGGKF